MLIVWIWGFGNDVPGRGRWYLRCDRSLTADVWLAISGCRCSKSIKSTLYGKKHLHQDKNNMPMYIYLTKPSKDFCLRKAPRPVSSAGDVWGIRCAGVHVYMHLRCTWCVKKVRNISLFCWKSFWAFSCQTIKENEQQIPRDMFTSWTKEATKNKTLLLIMFLWSRQINTSP